MQRSLEEDLPEPAEETQNAEEPKLSLVAANNNIGEEIPPKPEDFEEPDKTIQDSQIEVDVPTAAPIATDPPAPVEPLPKTPAPTQPYPRPDASITDLAKQELGNLLTGGPKPPEGSDATNANDDNTAGDNDQEPSEMDILVPETEAEEEEIDAEIEEWEEEHGKPKPEEQNEEELVPEPSEEDEEDETNEATSTETEEPEVPASSPTINPLVVTPSWTPPDIEPQHTLKPEPAPTKAPVPVPPPTMAPIWLPPPTRAPVRVPAPTSVSTPTGGSVVTQQEDVACQDYGTQTIAYMLCLYNIPPAVAPALAGVLLLIVLCCCWRLCCGKSKKEFNSRGEYRQIANTYGDADFDNAFSEDFSDEEDDEDMAWGESNGRRVLEMKNMGRRRGDDDLSLEEMNG